MSGIGHNSEAEIIRSINNSVDQLIKSEEKFDKLQEELDKNKDEEQEPILLELGRSLYEGKKFTADPSCGVEGKNPNERFNKWVIDNFPNLSETTLNEHDQVAVIWAAEYPEDYLGVKDRYSRVRTIRGRHSKWKEEQKANKDDNTDNDVVDPDEGGNDSKPGSGNNPSGQSGNTSSDKPSGGSSGDSKDTPKGEDKPKKPRPIHNPAYKIEDGMGCIKGVAESFCKEYTGTKEEAADVLFGMVVKGCESDSISMSISRDYAKWVLELKEVMDLAEPMLREFLNEEPELKVVK